MHSLITDLLPHAPKVGLYVAPDVPEKKLRGAVRDYAKGVQPEDVIALYDGTLLGNGRDGAIFLDDRLIFQNSDFEPAQTVHYRDLVNLVTKRSRLRGTYIEMEVNRRRATFSAKLDLSKHPGSLEYIERLLQNVMLLPEQSTPGETDWNTVSRVLGELRSSGKLTEADYHRLMNCRP